MKNFENIVTLFNSTEVDKFGRSILHYACAHGNLDYIEEKPNINDADIFGYTPLHYACLHGRKVVVEKLIAYDSIDVNKPVQEQNIDSIGSIELVMLVDALSLTNGRIHSPSIAKKSDSRAVQQSCAAELCSRAVQQSCAAELCI